MMKTKAIKIPFCFIIAVIIAAASLVAASAADVRYTNPETSNTVIIRDDLDLLTSQE